MKNTMKEANKMKSLKSITYNGKEYDINLFTAIILALCGFGTLAVFALFGLVATIVCLPPLIIMGIVIAIVVTLAERKESKGSK